MRIDVTISNTKEFDFEGLIAKLAVEYNNYEHGQKHDYDVEYAIYIAFDLLFKGCVAGFFEKLQVERNMIKSPVSFESAR